ncbi:MAG: hypothetical protein J6S84_07635 [Bacteroidales bacterium]|nr:hypothetical protein [Bacteroidales bacterium]
MKKTLVFIASALFVALMAASCNSNPAETTDDGIDSLIEEAVVEEPVENKALTDGKWVNNDFNTTIYQFNEDGTCRKIRKDSEFPVDETGTYTINGDSLKIVVKGDNFTATSNLSFKIAGDKLTIFETGFPTEYKWQPAE